MTNDKREYPHFDITVDGEFYHVAAPEITFTDIEDGSRVTVPVYNKVEATVADC